jgi:TPR repeat protein|tara:strand:+ start:130 stop:450 length:321 start_codon:yes stop_codon:yes gene_type:complete
MTRITVALATVLSLAFTPVAAQNYKKGMDAHNAGDYETAFNEWLPLAERGVANAQFALGVTYLTGLGVSLDHAVAVKWFRLAAEQGDAKHQSWLGPISADVRQNDH